MSVLILSAQHLIWNSLHLWRYHQIAPRKHLQAYFHECLASYLVWITGITCQDSMRPPCKHTKVWKISELEGEIFHEWKYSPEWILTQYFMKNRLLARNLSCSIVLPLLVTYLKSRDIWNQSHGPEFRFPFNLALSNFELPSPGIWWTDEWK